MSKAEDEIAIRSVVAAWMQATKRGDVETVRKLMTDDAIFLVAGQPPMDKAAFEAQSRAQLAENMKIEGHSEIREVRVEGSLGYMWSRLAVSITPAGGETVMRDGHTLTVFRKVNGQWLLSRDASLLVKVE